MCQLLAWFQGWAVVLGDVPRVVEFPRDPKDEPYLNLAIAAEADYLVTRDLDLLDLANPASNEGRAFRAQFPRLTITDPARFLLVMHGSGAGPANRV